MKRELKNRYRKNWILIWIILSVLYAMVIQVLFTIPAPNIWLEAHWTAGDILTYASTVSLGLLALWQNKHIQDENDVAQRKLEDIIYHSNEIGIITKIISHEEQRIETLERAMDTLVNLCDPALLIMICVKMILIR